MRITEETARLIDTLANAASKIGSTPASEKINKLIVSLLPGDAEESTAEALRQDNIVLQEELASLQTSARIGVENLEIVRGKLKEISMLATDLLVVELDDDLKNDLRKIVELSDDSSV